ncbi:hypothetical protein [Streptomyces sp. JJ66]|uniref:hypothetical protein n=1 Tax=Streptomyces sp. JJ66 TaxID=2803843 RepID=UPI0027E285B3|nr:hypothetical protein [Streptomyces sp. JJ66]
MIGTLNTTNAVTERSVVASCLLGGSLCGTGLSGVRISDERPTQAPAVAATAQANAYVFTAAAAGAGLGRQKKQHHTMWAFRGPEPWRDPA